MKATKMVLSFIIVGLLAALPVSADNAGKLVLPWGLITDGPGSGFDTFFTLKNTCMDDDMVVDVFYFNSAGERVARLPAFTLAAHSSMILNVEATLRLEDWYNGSVEVAWATRGEGRLCGYGMLVNTALGKASTIPMVPAPVNENDEELTRDKLTIPWGLIAGEKFTVFDFIVALKNTDNDRPAAVAFHYFKPDGTPVVDIPRLVIPPHGSIAVNVEDQIDVERWANGSLEIEVLGDGPRTVVGYGVQVDFVHGEVMPVPLIDLP